MDSNNAEATILLIGSDRISKLIPALKKTNKFNLKSNIWEGGHGYRSPSELWKLRNYLIESTNPLILVDSMGIQALQAGLMANYYNVPFFVRARGGMWKEYRDQRHEDPFYRAAPYSFSKEKIRNTTIYNADGIIPVSHFHKLQIVEELDVKPGKCSVVHTPVDFDRFERTEHSLDQIENINTDNDVLLSITSFKFEDKYSGILNFSKAIVRFLKKNPSWSFVVCGPGKQRDRVQSHFENIASQKLMNRISILGYQENIENLYSLSDVYIHLSFRESMGMTVLEAQAAGKPVIINNSGGPIDLIRQTNTEVKMIANTHEELVNSLTKLAANSELRSVVGEKNQEWVKQRFTYEKIGTDFSQTISELL
jgi:glycosyltransferase involved in cell wall biosynthesis